jgi:hypothetical protein
VKRIEGSIGEMVKELPLEFQHEVEDFVKFDWEGALEDLRDQYTSVELQHQISEWRAEEERGCR